MKLRLPEYFRTIYKRKGSANIVKRLLMPSMHLDCVIVESTRSYTILKSKYFKFCLTGNKDIYPDDINIVFKTNRTPTEERLQNDEIRIVNILKDNFDTNASVNDIINSWKDNFEFKSEDIEASIPGLRKPQIGALFSLMGHWQAANEIATIVLPTGVGKTETMISAMIANMSQKTLAIVPSDALRDQLFMKFYTLGLLRKFMLINEYCLYPRTGIIKQKFKNSEELRIFFEESNVIITTMSIASSWSVEEKDMIAKIVSCVFIDEAHHVKASSWMSFRNHFDKGKVVQLTATPFRNDRKKIDGKIIFNYPLKNAQEDGYYKKITFLPVKEYDEQKVDALIAKIAIKKLREDLSNGYQHILLARCDNRAKANKVFEYYKNESDLNPTLIYSGIKNKNIIQKSIISRKNKIIVAVDMLGEGFDLPELKIAAFHDIRKSLPITLQFAGRFTRTSFDSSLGEASFIANIADLNVKEELEELYAQDSDWNLLLAKLSGDAIDREIYINNFFQGFQDQTGENLSIQNIRSTLSTYAFGNSSDTWFPRNFKSGLDEYDKNDVKYYNLNSGDQVLVVITGRKNNIEWGNFKDIYEFNWTLIIAYLETKNNILFVHSTDKDLDINKFGKAILDGKEELIDKELTFKVLANIKRLLLKNVGLKEFIGRYISFKMSVGADVQKALSVPDQKKSQKSSLFGSGYDDGYPITIGCSYKGKIWSYAKGSILEYKEWCDKLGNKLNDQSINLKEVLEYTLSPEIISELPQISAIWIDWNPILVSKPESVIIITDGTYSESLLNCKLVVNPSSNSDVIIIDVIGAEIRIQYEYSIIVMDSIPKQRITAVQNDLRVQYYSQSLAGIDFLNKYLPTIWFADGSALEGTEYISLKRASKLFNENRLISWDWSSVNISKEARGVEPIILDSIQQYVINNLLGKEFDIIYDDDYSGEIADIITIKAGKDKIVFQLYHLKYAKNGKTGNDISNFYEVCGQAQKSIKWQHQKGDKLISRLLKREPKSRKGKTCSRLIKGSISQLENLKKIAKKEIPIQFEIFIVQPSLVKGYASEEILSLLGVTESYLVDLAQVELQVICS